MTKLTLGAACLGVLAVGALATEGYSQTRLGNPQEIRPSAGGGQPAPTAQPAPAVTQEPLPTLPVAPDSVRQASEQLNGKYGDMQRLPVGGQIQEAWDKANAKSGIHQVAYCDVCSYRMNVREQMTSIIQLPAGMVIVDFDVGDGRLFNVARRSDRVLAIKPGTAGIDTSLIVYTKDGAALTFYVRAHGIHSETIPDLKFIVEGQPVRLELALNDSIGDKSSVAVSAMVVPDQMSPSDMVRNEPQKSNTDDQDDDQGGASYFDVRIKDVSWSGYSLEGDEALAPESIYNDGRFTYLVYGERWQELSFPSVHVVEADGIDQVVNFRIVDGVLIVEEVADLISLKSGSIYLCIHYDPEDSSWF